nr:uncharacterized protein LOC131755483 isoform X1 [Kogia breviceps]
MSQWHHARERWSQDRGFSGRTFIGQEEGRKGHPGKVERVSPSGTADAWDSLHCFQSSFKKGTLLGAGDTVVGKIDVVPAFWEFTVWLGDQHEINKHRSKCLEVSLFSCV